jgi:hypothetical protein
VSVRRLAESLPPDLADDLGRLLGEALVAAYRAERATERERLGRTGRGSNQGNLMDDEDHG